MCQYERVGSMGRREGQVKRTGGTEMQLEGFRTVGLVEGKVEEDEILQAFIFVDRF